MNNDIVVYAFGVSKDELKTRWGRLPRNGKEFLFDVCTTKGDSRHRAGVIEMGLEYAFQVCSERTLRCMVSYLARDWEEVCDIFIFEAA